MKTKRKHKEMKDEEELGVHKIISKIQSEIHIVLL